MRIFRILGRMTGRAVSSRTFDRTLTVAAGYIISEMKLADLRAKRMILKRKLSYHLELLGKTTHRLMANDIDPVSDNHTHTIINVLDEIKSEIQVVDTELTRRKEVYREKKQKTSATKGT